MKSETNWAEASLGCCAGVGAAGEGALGAHISVQWGGYFRKVSGKSETNCPTSQISVDPTQDASEAPTPKGVGGSPIVELSGA
ncbi:hypothetical protein BH23ACT6_BH23ACT6_19460 [soil metagenome]